MKDGLTNMIQALHKEISESQTGYLQGLIKGQGPRAKRLAYEDKFSHQVCPPVKTSCHPAENVNETSVFDIYTAAILHACSSKKYMYSSLISATHANISLHLKPL